MPLQNAKLRIKGLCLSLKPAKYATVIGRSDNEHGPRLVNNPQVKTIAKVRGLGLVSPSVSKRSLLRVKSESVSARDEMVRTGRTGSSFIYLN